MTEFGWALVISVLVAWAVCSIPVSAIVGRFLKGRS